MDRRIYPVVIVGMGPAGYTASIYLSRYKIEHLVVGQVSGGQLGEAHKICNYPGFKDITGLDLADKIRDHALSLGAKEKFCSIAKIERLKDNSFRLVDYDNNEIFANAVIIAIGKKHRKLGVPREDYYYGKGLGYCATCDGPLFRNKVVTVVGGANAAITAALMFADLASQVYLVYRGDALKGEQAWIDLANKNSKIIQISGTNILSINGDAKVESVVLDKPFNGSQELKTDGIFVEVGSEPAIVGYKNIDLKVDDRGYIIVDNYQATSQDGIFAAGDITTNSGGFKQVVTACAEGAIASESVRKYLINLRK